MFGVGLTGAMGGTGAGSKFFPGAGIDMNFVTGDFLGKTPADLTCVRASSKYFQLPSGLWTSVSSNVLAWIIGVALSMEEARTNVALWCRDLTNAAWTKITMTAALDQTGIDGTANSASSITATSANATVLQAITLASSARFQSAFVKRLTGTGAVSMTMDGGTTWVDITSQLGAGVWARATIPTQTLANPSVGFKLATSGDAIAVDFVQNENSADMASSPILTTSAAATRAADKVTLPLTLGAAYSMFSKAKPPNPMPTNVYCSLSISDGTDSNRVTLRRSNAQSVIIEQSGGAVLINAAMGGVPSYAAGISGKAALAVAAGDIKGAFNGSLDTNSYSVALPVSPNQAVLGATGAGTAQFWNGLIERIAIWPSTRISNTLLQQITT